MAEIHYSGVDWREVLGRVAVRTARVFVALGLARGAAVRPYGKSPEDFVMEAAVRLLDPNDMGIAWNVRYGKPTTDGVVKFLNSVIRNDILDVLKEGSQHRRTRDLHAAGTKGLSEARASDPPDEHATSEREVLSKLDRERAYMTLLEAAEAQGDLEVVDYLLAQFSEGEYLALKPQEAADKLRTSSTDITNRKRRLARLIAELFAPAANEASSPMGRRR